MQEVIDNTAFILSGDRGAGKSTLLLRLSQELAVGSRRRSGLRLGGYYTLRCLDPSGQLLGFALRDAASLAERARLPLEAAFCTEVPDDSTCFLSFTAAGPLFRQDVFAQQSRALLTKALQRAQEQGQGAFLMLDEVGGPELLDDSFFFYLVKLFLQNIPILLVLKSSESLHGMLRRLSPAGVAAQGANSTVAVRLEERRQWLAGRGRLLMLEGTEDSRQRGYAVLQKWLGEQEAKFAQDQLKYKMEEDNFGE